MKIKRKTIMQLVENKNAMSISMMSAMDGRGSIANALAKILASQYTLYLKTQFYHWNIVGPNFVSLHNLFETQYLELASSVDEIAERIRALGYFSPGSYIEFIKLTDIQEDESVPNSSAMLKNLLDATEKCIQLCLDTMNLCGNKDPVTQDMMIARMKLLQKNAWMIRSVMIEN
jgi:starvation-inducible DNA-binding protein